MKFRDIEIEGMKEILADKEAYIKKLEEENKTLKKNIAWYEKEEDRLREENKSLKEIIKNSKTD